MLLSRQTCWARLLFYRGVCAQAPLPALSYTRTLHQTSNLLYRMAARHLANASTTHLRPRRGAIMDDMTEDSPNMEEDMPNKHLKLFSYFG